MTDSSPSIRPSMRKEEFRFTLFTTLNSCTPPCRLRAYRGLWALVFLAAATRARAQELRVPAFTAYVEPNAEGANVSEQSGVTEWRDGAQRIVWIGKTSAGEARFSIVLSLPKGETAILRLSVGKRKSEREIKGADAEQSVDFGAFTLPKSGYQRIELQGIKRSGGAYPALKTLQINGLAAQNAHFSLVERRNAASVHLSYPLPKEAQIEWFYNEVTVRTTPLWSYYMACGFRRGYFGIQVNSPTERRVIFSVWDAGKEPDKRDLVPDENRVKLLAKGENVVADSFGGEGTGGHSHLVYPWKQGETYRFLVHAKPEGAFTTYSGYFYFPETQKWGLIARFRAPKDGSYLQGLYSFNENFGGANGQLLRLAEFGKQWVGTKEGAWIELTQAKFSHDSHGKTERKDYAAGVKQGRFYLANGGFTENGVRYGDKIDRPRSKNPLEGDPLPE